MLDGNFGENQKFKEVFFKTRVIKKPITGIISDYHQLPYILVAPDEKDPTHTVEVNGNIHVSPRFVLSAESLGETFGEVFDPGTFDKDIEARMFSFVYAKKRTIKLENKDFKISNFEERPEEHINRVLDTLMQQENIRTGLIFGPRFSYYPISIDKFIREILDREFNT
jgi:hypothetical protein